MNLESCIQSSATITQLSFDRTLRLAVPPLEPIDIVTGLKMMYFSEGWYALCAIGIAMDFVWFDNVKSSTRSVNSCLLVAEIVMLVTPLLPLVELKLKAIYIVLFLLLRYLPITV
jgi:hypothetical protein